ncbi:MAG TPA: baseplate J/gp47 family protein, partial [Kofleriaceae bacterium]|nr:baseplate J/gp47 family protein [Kofleriaceae bacterium]
IRPVGDRMQKVNMQIVAMTVPAQDGITKDNVTVRVDAVVYFMVGLTRRTRVHAVGTVVFARTTPATADIFIPAGTRVSTADAPVAVFQTTADGLLRRGNLSTEVPIRAEASGPTGVVAAGAIRVLHRPLFGLDSGVSNPAATALGSADETDEELRRRARRALETGGRATTGALVGALASLPGVRDKYIRADEDDLLRPGVVSLRVAADLDDDTAARAVELIEANRPAGIRILHDLDRHATIGALEPALDLLDDDPDAPAATLGGDGVYFPVVIAAQILPASAALSPQERAALAAAGKQAVAEFIADVGVGEPLIYNKLIAALMGLPGVLDVRVEMYPQGAPPEARRKRNLEPNGPLRPTADLAHGGGTVVEVGGELIALDLTISVTLLDAGALGDPEIDREEARRQIARQIRDGVSQLSQLSAGALKGLALHSDTYRLDSVSYKAEFIHGGVRLILDNPPLTVGSLERPWVRSLVLAGGG